VFQKYKKGPLFEISVSLCQFIAFNWKISVYQKVYEHTVVQM